MKLFQHIEAGRKALVAGLLSNTEKVVIGPARVPFWARVRQFKHQIINEGERFSIYDENGVCTEMDGPQAIDIHPDGSGLLQQKYHLASNEALVIIQKDGTRRFVFGKKPPELTYGEELSVVYVGSNERVHLFNLTGKGDADGLNKQPGALKLPMLRLSPTQSYFAVQVRTKTDHTPLVLKLMIFFKISDLLKFVNSSDDPFGVMFNTIMTNLVAAVSGMTFDDFKREPNKMVEGELSTEKLKVLEGYGIAIEKVMLRGWEPQDGDVQRVLNEAALTNTRREIQRAQHAARLEAIEQERAELEKSQSNEQLQLAAAQAKGENAGREFAAFLKTVTEQAKAIPEAARNNFLMLKVAGDAVSEHGGQLSLPQTLLSLSGEKSPETTLQG